MTIERIPIKHIATIVGRIGWHGLTTNDYDTVGEYLVTGTEIQGGTVVWDRCHRVSTEIWKRDPRIQISDGDILVTKDGTIGKVALVTRLPGPATLNSGVFRVTPRKRILRPRFAFWVLSSRLFIDFIDLLSSGSTINHLYQEDFVNFRLPLPSLDEQRTIADYLDRETARIDALIAGKQRMAELLEERDSIAFERVIKGYGFTFPGELQPHWGNVSIPAGWRIMRLSLVLDQLTNGYVGPTRDILVDSGVPYIQSLHIKNGRIDFSKREFFVSPSWHNERPRIHLLEGDVLIVQTGDIGQIAVVPEGFGEASCHALQIARVNRKVMTGPYLGSYLRSFFGYHSLLSRATGALHPHLEAGIKDIPVVVPPLGLQGRIVEEVRRANEESSGMRSTLDAQTQLLQERRQALITAAVTGQLDIPEAA
jgi:type I restriction enzyme, S subunit